MKLRHTILSLALATCATAAMQATTPVRRTISHQQPNGQVVTINAVGNGRYTLYSLDGTAVLPGIHRPELQLIYPFSYPPISKTR